MLLLLNFTTNFNLIPTRNQLIPLFISTIFLLFNFFLIKKMSNCRNKFVNLQRKRIIRVMTKYNITEKKEKEAHYRTLVNPKLMDEMRDRILSIIVMQKKYKEKDYSAKKLAEELGTNTRYISAVVNVKFHMNYTSFVNKFRIEEAMAILVDRRYQKLRIEEVSDMVGFSNRQSFYASFFKVMNMTPREYRIKHLDMHPGEKVVDAKKKKKKQEKKGKKVKPEKKIVE